MGKSSLAKQVYNNESVKIHFGERIWIPDLKDFDIRKTLNKMVEFLGRSNSENASTETTIRKLQECLRGKSYLLVLDDVWNTNQQCWDLMRYELERVGGSMESMVLVTTRDDVVAKAMHASSVHYLSGLSKDDSWALFNQIAFVNRPIRDVFALEVSGRKIVEKCKGVPLAIKSIGGLLQGKEKPYEWTIIEESELWDIPHLETGILPSLKLSYNHLSSPLLKKCFSLCALWPKGSCFEKYDFIHRWIALGLIQKHNNENMTMEDIGESYLNELLSLSFLFVDKRNELGEAIEYSLHDLVYDLARSVASCERLYLEASKKVNNVPHIQHLTVVGHAELTSVFPDKLVLEKIRSLDSVENLPRGLLRHVKYLRVLSLLRSNVEKLPEMIGKLKCLKFLDMTENPIKVLPQSILELYSLQSLILYRCQQLVKLPRGQLSNLANLRHLCLSFSFCPAKGILQQLNQLQTLPPLQLSKGGFQISELGSLHQIQGNLEIKGLELVQNKLDADKANLSKQPRIEQLRISWNKTVSCINCEDVLDRLSPHTNLKLLSIKGYVGHKFPSWVMKMKLPTLGHLGSIKMIEIRNMKKVKQIGHDFYSGAGADLLMTNNETQAMASSSKVKSGPGTYFASLKKLGLCRLDIPEGLGECTSLRILSISCCKKLSSLPSNLSKLVSLEEFGIWFCPNLVSIPNVSGLGSMQKFMMVRNDGLRKVPEGLQSCKSVDKLWVNACEKVDTLLDLEGLSRLSNLGIIGTTKMIRQPPDWLFILSCLRILHIGEYRELNEFPDLSPLLRLTFLEILYVYGWKPLQSVPEQLQHFTKLRGLGIVDFDYLEHLPDWLRHLSSLQYLYPIKGCHGPTHLVGN
ncbi:putative disease resistance protein RGA4 [Bienertia sinuspersici]